MEKLINVENEWYGEVCCPRISEEEGAVSEMMKGSCGVVVVRLWSWIVWVPTSR